MGTTKVPPSGDTLKAYLDTLSPEDLETFRRIYNVTPHMTMEDILWAIQTPEPLPTPPLKKAVRFDRTNVNRRKGRGREKRHV